MAIINALILFLNAEQTEDPDLMRIIFMFNGEWTETDISYAYAPKELFYGLRNGKYVYVSGFEKNGNIYFDEMIIARSNWRY